MARKQDLGPKSAGKAAKPKPTLGPKKASPVVKAHEAELASSAMAQPDPFPETDEVAEAQTKIVQSGMADIIGDKPDKPLPAYVPPNRDPLAPVVRCIHTSCGLDLFGFACKVDADGVVTRKDGEPFDVETLRKLAGRKMPGLTVG